MQNKIKVNRWVIAILGLLLVSHSFAAVDGWQLNMYKGVTPISHDIYQLHMIAMLKFQLRTRGVDIATMPPYSRPIRYNSGFQPEMFM